PLAWELPGAALIQPLAWELPYTLGVASIPDLAKGVKDLVLPKAVTQVKDVARIQHGCGCNVHRQLQLQCKPWPGNFR
ncbi:hypothetical protein, partial [Streptococcus suis]|uniref:hypothetical protein n=1 Tax=Streptococcus suis TaxID=1307 RepID=UPI0029C3E1A7